MRWTASCAFPPTSPVTSPPGDAEVQLIVHGGDANRARIIQGYVQGAVGAWAAREAAQGRTSVAVAGQRCRRGCGSTKPTTARYFLVPGLVVLVMTLIGGLLTAMVMAREWERGTLEALLVTPVRSDEILLGKTLPYFLLGAGRLRAVRARRPGFCFTCRCAARCGCCSAPRCCTCWWRWASAC